jgi:hypothetical protein
MDTWQVRTGDVAAPGDDTWTQVAGSVQDTWQLQSSDTCQADLAFLAYGWTNPEVTRVTTGRVTRGRDDVSS